MRAAAIFFGIVLCLAGAFFTLIEGLKQPAYDIEPRLNAGNPVGREEMTLALENAQALAALGWKDAEMLKASALMEYTLAHDGAFVANPNPWLGKAIAHLSAGLALSPADPLGWQRLATMRDLAGAPVKDIGSALSMSVATGPAILPVVMPRLRLELGYASQLPADSQALFGEQMQLLKRCEPANAPLLEKANTVSPNVLGPGK